MTFLSGPGQKAYRVNTGKPRATENAGTAYAALEIAGGSLATSSDATHCYDSDGIHWCHLIDPRTGRPINCPDEAGLQAGIASVTLMGENAALLDALGTALCVMGPEEAVRRMNSQDERIIMVLWRSDRTDYEVISTLPEGTWELLDPAYHHRQQE